MTKNCHGSGWRNITRRGGAFDLSIQHYLALMPEDGYSTTGWDSTEPSETSYGRPSITSRDGSAESTTGLGHQLRAGSPQPRISSDSGGVSSGSRWRDTATALSDSQEISAPNAELVEATFDENVLRALCDMDVCAALISYAKASQILSF